MSDVIKESDIYDRINFRFDDRELSMQRIESGGTGLGIPDVFYSTKNRSGWIEMKRIKYVPRKSTEFIDIPFRAGQYPWIRKYLPMDSPVHLFVVVCYGPYEGNVFVFEKENVRPTYSKKDFIAMNSLMFDLREVPKLKLLNILNN